GNSAMENLLRTFSGRPDSLFLYFHSGHIPAGPAPVVGDRDRNLADRHRALDSDVQLCGTPLRRSPGDSSAKGRDVADHGIRCDLGSYSGAGRAARVLLPSFHIARRAHDCGLGLSHSPKMFGAGGSLHFACSGRENHVVVAHMVHRRLHAGRAFPHVLAAESEVVLGIAPARPVWSRLTSEPTANVTIVPASTYQV